MADEDPTPDPEGATPPDPTSDPDAEPELSSRQIKKLGGGEDGLKADLAFERKKRQALETQIAELQAAQMTDSEKALADARREGETTATTTMRSRLFAAEAKVAAAGRLQDPALLADPAVALSLLGLPDVPVTADGDIDTDAVTAAVEALVESKPYLAAGTNGVPNPGSADGGARGTGKPPTIADQIAAAEKAGDWTTAGRLKSQQLMQLHTTT